MCGRVGLWVDGWAGGWVVVVVNMFVRAGSAMVTGEIQRDLVRIE